MHTPEDEIQSTQSKLNLNCRYYRDHYPSKDELVMIQVLSEDDFGVRVSLLEYNQLEGLIIRKNYSGRKFSSARLAHVGKKEVAVVVQVDERLGFVDLSKKQVWPEDIAECENKYNKSKSLHSILRHVAQTTGTDMETLYDTIGWPLYDRYDHALDALKKAVHDPDTVFTGLEMSPEIRDSLMSVVRMRLTPPKIRVQTLLSITCYEYEGIDAIKEAVIAARSLGTSDIEVSIWYHAAPIYMMVITAKDKKIGLSMVTACIEIIQEKIKASGGCFAVKVGPCVLGEDGEGEIEGKNEKVNDVDGVECNIKEDNHEGMGDIDIGIDTTEMDAKYEEEQQDSD